MEYLKDFSLRVYILTSHSSWSNAPTAAKSYSSTEAVGTVLCSQWCYINILNTTTSHDLPYIQIMDISVQVPRISLHS